MENFLCINWFDLSDNDEIFLVYFRSGYTLEQYDGEVLLINTYNFIVYKIFQTLNNICNILYLSGQSATWLNFKNSLVYTSTLSLTH